MTTAGEVELLFSDLRRSADTFAELIAEEAIPGEDEDFRAWATDALRARVKHAASKAILDLLNTILKVQRRKYK